MSRRLTIASLITLALVGFALRAASSSFTLNAIGYFIVGVAGVLAIAALFFAIGASEDRERRNESPPDDEPHH